MVERALAVLGLTAEVEIHIEKRLPVQGGLGAGSANAAAALLGLERELGVALSADDRLRVAAEVGSDVPLFLLGGAVLGLGRGEEVSPLADVPAMPCVVAVPEIGVSTPAAFREWDARHSALTPEASADRLNMLSRSVSAAWGQPHSSGVSWSMPSGLVGPKDYVSAKGDLAETPLLALVRTGIANDFEEVVFAQYPSLADIVRVLAASDQTGGCGSLCGAFRLGFGPVRAVSERRSGRSSGRASSEPRHCGAAHRDLASRAVLAHDVDELELFRETAGSIILSPPAACWAID